MPTKTICKFPYTQNDVTDIYGKKIGEAYRPILPITLFCGNKKLNVLGLIDTGSDECLFPGELATLLGHNLTKGNPRTFNGIGGAITAYLHQTDVSVCSCRFKINIYYSDNWNKLDFGLLGQNGFLTHFDVLFSRKNKEFSLIPKQ